MVKVKTTRLGTIARIEFWTKRYEFSFQFWGDGNNNVFINKDDVEVASFGGDKTIHEILKRALDWCEKVNPKIKYPDCV
jgi:hypothetical protein